MSEGSKPEATDVPPPELPDSSLDQVVGGTNQGGIEGGKAEFSSVVITKLMDQASPDLFQQATGGSTEATGTTDTIVPKN